MTLPTDRSMPPPMITIVTPTVITPITEAEVRIVSRLERVRNVSAVDTPTMPSSTSTATRPRFRAGAESSSLLSGLADGAASRAAFSTRLCSSTAGTAVFVIGVWMASGMASGMAQPWAVPSITRSRTRLSSRSALGAVRTTRPSRTTSTRSARPSTSGTSLDTRTTATPESASLRMRA